MENFKEEIWDKLKENNKVLTFLNKQYLWCSILKVNDEYFLGILNDGTWSVKTNLNLFLLDDEKSFLKMVVLLEQPLDDTKARIEEFFKKAQVSVNIQETFPFEKIVQAGFEFGTPYWAEKAFTWYDKLKIEEKVQLKNSLDKLKNEKWLSQKLKQKVRKELKLLENV